MNDREVLRSIEAWTGRRSYLPAIAWARASFALFVLALVLFLLSGCTTTTTRTITTDKAGTVTDTTVVTKTTDKAVYDLAGVVVTSYAPPRARVIREEKSAVIPGDVRRILRGPIQPREIALRWRPAAP